VAQLAEDGTAEQAPEPVPRDVAEQRAKPPAVQAEVHDPGGDVDEVCLPDQLDLQAAWAAGVADSASASIAGSLERPRWPARRRAEPPRARRAVASSPRAGSRSSPRDPSR
jgi:hypothetical protein